MSATKEESEIADACAGLKVGEPVTTASGFVVKLVDMGPPRHFRIRPEPWAEHIKYRLPVIDALVTERRGARG